MAETGQCLSRASTNHYRAGLIKLLDLLEFRARRGEPPQDCSSADEFGRPARSSFREVRAWRTG